MLDILARDCGTHDYSLTPKSLRKFRVFSAMALIGFPLFSIVGMWDWLDDFTKPVEFVVSLCLLMSFLPLVSDRVYNRLNRHKGRLDEREKETMRQAQAFSYRAIIITLLTAIIIGLGLSGLSGVEFKAPHISIGLAAIALMNIVFVMLFLPITYIAWTQKTTGRRYLIQNQATMAEPSSRTRSKGHFMLNLADVKMTSNSLNSKQLSSLRWAATLAIMGIPVLAQILGAMMMFSQSIPQLMSGTALFFFGLACLFVLIAGIYVCSNRLHLRFLGFNRGLDEWEKAMQMKAKAFAYQVVFMVLLTLFVITSLAGFVGIIGLVNLTDMNIGKTLTLSTFSVSIFVVMSFYIIMFLPTLHMVWNIKPLSTED